MGPTIGIVMFGLIIWAAIMAVTYMGLDSKWHFKGMKCLQPYVIYRNTKLNYFGTAVVCLGLNLLFLPVAFCFWFHKLCTVGRRQSFGEENEK